MKINLTKLLEIKSRVKIINPKTNNTTTPSMISKEATSADRAYSFELERVEKEE